MENGFEEKGMLQIPKLPLSAELETRPVLKKLSLANRALAELKGVTEIIPNQAILLNTLSLQEAKDSSEIENIITTQDELFKSDSISQKFTSNAAKEVYNYAAALRSGYESVKRSRLLRNSTILSIQERIVENSAGYRTLPGTELKNDLTGAVIYTPPQEADLVKSLMSELEKLINDNSLDDLDPLTKMAVIHHQFESIHPFYDGNGRTGRIINVLYLVKEGLLNTPVLYLSRYINKNKSEYYRLLQAVRDQEAAWEDWVLFMLDAVEQTSYNTIRLVHGIRDLMQCHKRVMRDELPKIYSQDLLNNLFRHPYTKTEFVIKDLQVSRITAARYLNELVSIGILTKHRLWKENYYLNNSLFNLLIGAS